MLTGFFEALTRKLSRKVPVRFCGLARGKAELAQRLKSIKWTETDLAKRRKGESGKVRLATALRAQTTMPLAWIAQRLAMGSRGYLAWLLHRADKDQDMTIPLTEPTT